MAGEAVVVNGEGGEGHEVRYVAPEGAEPAAPEVAEVDTLIERADLGVKGATTIVRAGDPIPPGLDKLPRRPARSGVSRSAGASTSKRSSTRRSGAAKKKGPALGLG